MGKRLKLGGFDLDFNIPILIAPGLHQEKLIRSFDLVSKIAIFHEFKEKAL